MAKKRASKVSTEPVVISSELRRAIERSWQEIAWDCIQACNEDGEPITNAAAIECACDAGRLDQYPGAAAELAALEKKHGYEAVDTALCAQIRLPTCL